TAVAEAKKAVETVKARLDAAPKELRPREKDLDDIAPKRSKSEGRLSEDKTTVEDSADLTEIENIKAQKAQTEDEIVALIEREESLVAESREAETRLGGREEQGKRDEGVIRAKLAAVEKELGGVRTERAAVTGKLPRKVLTDYERILKARSGLAIAPV